MALAYPRASLITVPLRDPFFPRVGQSFMAVKLQTSGMHMSISAARKPNSDSSWTTSLPVQKCKRASFQTFQRILCFKALKKDVPQKEHNYWKHQKFGFKKCVYAFGSVSWDSWSKNGNVSYFTHSHVLPKHVFLLWHTKELYIGKWLRWSFLHNFWSNRDAL